MKRIKSIFFCVLGLMISNVLAMHEQAPVSSSGVQISQAQKDTVVADSQKKAAHTAPDSERKNMQQNTLQQKMQSFYKALRAQVYALKDGIVANPVMAAVTTAMAVYIARDVLSMKSGEQTLDDNGRALGGNKNVSNNKNKSAASAGKRVNSSLSGASSTGKGVVRGQGNGVQRKKDTTLEQSDTDMLDDLDGITDEDVQLLYASQLGASNADTSASQTRTGAQTGLAGDKKGGVNQQNTVPKKSSLAQGDRNTAGTQSGTTRSQAQAGQGTDKTQSAASHGVAKSEIGSKVPDAGKAQSGKKGVANPVWEGPDVLKIKDTDSPEMKKFKVQVLQAWKNKTLDACDAKGYTLLHKAVYDGSLEQVQILIDCGASPRVASTNPFKYTPLHSLCHYSCKALEKDKLAMIDLLAVTREDVNAVDSRGNTPIMVLLQDRKCLFSVVRKLIEDPGINLGVANTHTKSTALMLAIENGRTNIVLHALCRSKKYLNPDMVDSKGETALYKVAHHNGLSAGDKKALLVGLINTKANINKNDYKDGWHILKYAVANNDQELVTVLCNKLVKVDTHLGNELDALLQAKPNAAIDKLLAGQNKKLDEAALAKNNLFLAAVETQDSMHVQCALEGIDYEATDAEGNTVLHLALKKGASKWIIGELMRGCSDKKAQERLINAKNHEGYTALLIAIGMNNEECVEYLAERMGAEGLNAVQKGRAEYRVINHATQASIAHFTQNMKGDIKDLPDDRVDQWGQVVLIDQPQLVTVSSDTPTPLIHALMEGDQPRSQIHVGIVKSLLRSKANPCTTLLLGTKIVASKDTLEFNNKTILLPSEDVERVYGSPLTCVVESNNRALFDLMADSIRVEDFDIHMFTSILESGDVAMVQKVIPFERSRQDSETLTLWQNIVEIAKKDSHDLDKSRFDELSAALPGLLRKNGWKEVPPQLTEREIRKAQKAAAAAAEADVFAQA